MQNRDDEIMQEKKNAANPVVADYQNMDNLSKSEFMKMKIALPIIKKK